METIDRRSSDTNEKYHQIDENVTKKKKNRLMFDCWKFPAVVFVSVIADM